MQNQLSRKRLIQAIFLSWIGVIGFDFFLHGGLLAGLYAQDTPFLLTPELAFRRIPLGYLSFLVFQIFLVWLMSRLMISGRRAGLIFGLQLGGFTWGAFLIGLFSISTISLNLLAGWFIGQTIESGLGGLIAGEALVTSAMGRLAAAVAGLVAALFIITIIIQSSGIFV